MSIPQNNLDPAIQSKIEKEVMKMVKYRQNIREFIFDMWGLTPQPVRPEYAKQWDEVCLATGERWEELKETVTGDWFGYPSDADNRGTKEWYWYTKNGYVFGRSEFLKQKHFSWQQNLVLMGVEKAAKGEASRLLTTVSGHGTGKSATTSWIILWFLYCYFGAQVPVTAPTSHQMHDVLWKELSIWIKRMPEDKAELYEWSSEYVRMAYDPEAWFARARTSTKENTEAIAGVHSDHVAIAVDEASGVPQQVYETAEGALTSGNVFVFLISNGTQSMGYFFDSHHSQKKQWQCFAFNSEESPLVDRQYIILKVLRHGKNSEEYKIRVSGGFPGEDAMDDSGYVQLFTPQRIIVRPESDIIPFTGRKILGVDPSGEGDDIAAFAIRDQFKTGVVERMSITNPKRIAEAILTLMDVYNIKSEDVVVGAFGVGTDVGKEVAIATHGKCNIYTPLEGTQPEKEEEYNVEFFTRLPNELQNPYMDDVRTLQLREEDVHEEAVDLFQNLRALMYFRLNTLLNGGLEILDKNVDNSTIKYQLSMIKYKRTLQGNKIQLMSKKEMKKLGIQSPNEADAIALTTLRILDSVPVVVPGAQQKEDTVLTDDERFSAL